MKILGADQAIAGCAVNAGVTTVWTRGAIIVVVEIAQWALSHAHSVEQWLGDWAAKGSD